MKNRVTQKSLLLFLLSLFILAILGLGCSGNVGLRRHTCGVFYIWRTNQQKYRMTEALIGKINAGSESDAKNEVYKLVLEDYVQKGINAAEGYETRAAISEKAISKPGDASTVEPVTGWLLPPIWCVDAGPVEGSKGTSPAPTGFPGGGDKAQPGMDLENQESSQDHGGEI